MKTRSARSAVVPKFLVTSGTRCLLPRTVSCAFGDALVRR